MLKEFHVYIPTHIPGREEAIDLGLPFYGEVVEVYRDLFEDADEAALLYMLGRHSDIVTSRTAPKTGEILGTAVSMIAVDSNKIVLASLVERAYHRSERSYKRHVRKAIKQDAATITAFNRALTTSS